MSKIGRATTVSEFEQQVFWVVDVPSRTYATFLIQDPDRDAQRIASYYQLRGYEYSMPDLRAHLAAVKTEAERKGAELRMRARQRKYRDGSVARRRQGPSVEAVFNCSGDGYQETIVIDPVYIPVAETNIDFDWERDESGAYSIGWGPDCDAKEWWEYIIPTQWFVDSCASDSTLNTQWQTAWVVGVFWNFNFGDPILPTSATTTSSGGAYHELSWDPWDVAMQNQTSVSTGGEFAWLLRTGSTYGWALESCTIFELDAPQRTVALRR